MSFALPAADPCLILSSKIVDRVLKGWECLGGGGNMAFLVSHGDPLETASGSDPFHSLPFLSHATSNQPSEFRMLSYDQRRSPEACNYVNIDGHYTITVQPNMACRP